MTPEEYRAKALEAERLAEESRNDDKRRRTLLDQASGWRSCADQAEFIDRDRQR